ncbi:MAG: FHA domain-containing protein [Byssovorax sp.]
MALTLVVVSAERGGEGRELSLTLDAPLLVIGRGEGCDLRLPDPSVSQRHATIRQRGGEHLLVDEGSVNGTFHAAVRLPPQTPRALRSGDKVRLGRVWIEVRIEPALVKGSTAAAAKELALTLVAQGLAAAGEDPWPTITVLEGPDAGKALVLRDPGRQYVIGRAKDIDLSLDDMSVARRHAGVERKGDGAAVQDLGSPSGTWLDDRHLGDRESLWRPGQVLRVGATRLGLTYPAAEALAELARSPEEKMRPGEIPALPVDPGDPAGDGATPDPDETPATPGASAVIDKDFTPTPTPISEALEGPRRGPKPKKRAEGSFGLADAVVVLLALGVLAASAVAAWWLFGR